MYNRNNDKFNGDLLKAEIARANELGKAIHGRELNPFDRASIEFVNQYKDSVEVQQFQDQMKRICALAGINYELEKSLWWAKYHQKQDKRD